MFCNENLTNSMASYVPRTQVPDRIYSFELAVKWSNFKIKIPLHSQMTPNNLKTNTKQWGAMVFGSCVLNYVFASNSITIANKQKRKFKNKTKLIVFSFFHMVASLVTVLIQQIITIFVVVFAQCWNWKQMFLAAMPNIR